MGRSDTDHAEAHNAELTAVTPSGAIAQYDLEAVIDTALLIEDGGTTVILTLAATDGTRRWDYEMELEQLDHLIAVLKKKRGLVLQRKYGHAKGARRGNR